MRGDLRITYSLRYLDLKALYIIEPGKTEIREVDKPSVASGNVLLRVSKVGFCGGDLNAYRGTFSLQEYPVILGHEIGAVIEECGSGVPSRYLESKKVTIMPYKNCGACISCRRGFPNACIDNRTLGVRRPGAMTDYILVSWRDIYSSEILNTTELALVEPLSVGFHAVQRGQILEEDTVVVLGCGLVGIGAVASAAERGAKVVAVDIEDKKIEIAKAAGALYGINSLKTDTTSEILNITSGEGPEVVIEAIGNPSTFRFAVDIVCFTGTVVYIGYAKRPVEYETKTIVQKELNIYGSRNCLKEFSDVIKYLEKGYFPVNDVVSKIVTLEQAGQALADWSEQPGAFTKIIVDLET